jgi:glycosyltransferase involved in cell wall biosynthesis
MRLLREPHRGPGAARNAGVRAARSEWIAFLDADDLWYPSKLERMTAAMRACPAANVYCHNEMLGLPDGRERITDYGARIDSNRPLAQQLFRDNCFSTSALVCQRDMVLRWGGFDEALSSAQDYELWLRMSPDLVPKFVPEVLGTYVVRQGNISTSRYWRRLLNILRVKHRHRAKGGTLLYIATVLRVTCHHVLAPALTAIRGH